MPKLNEYRHIEIFFCVICQLLIEEQYTNNPSPIYQTGSCCDDCNYEVVIPARLRQLKERESNG